MLLIILNEGESLPCLGCSVCQCVSEGCHIESVIGTAQDKALRECLAAGFYMTLPRGSVQRGGDRAWLVSPTMKGSEDPMCLAFWCVPAEAGLVS